MLPWGEAELFGELDAEHSRAFYQPLTRAGAAAAIAATQIDEDMKKQKEIRLI